MPSSSKRGTVPAILGLPPLPEHIGIARASIRVSSVSGRGKQLTEQEQSAGRRQSEFLSPDIQITEALAYAEYNKYRFDREASLKHADIDVSGFRGTWRKRPGLPQHLADAKHGEFQHLIFYKLSRLARNAREGLEIFEEFEQAGVTIHFVKEKIDTSTAIGRFFRTMMLGFAEMQSEELSQYSADLMRYNAERGEWRSTAPAWITRGTDGKAMIDEEAAAPYLRMIELRLSGVGYRGIAQALNVEGYTMPRSGNSWSQDAIARNFAEGRFDRLVGTPTYHLRDGRHIAVPSAYPALITPAQNDSLIATANNLRAIAVSPTDPGEKSSRVEKRRASIDSRYLVAGLARCGICGGRMQSSSGGGGLSGSGTRLRAYACQDARVNRAVHGESAKSGTTVSADALEEAVKYATVAWCSWSEYEKSLPQVKADKKPKKPKPKADAATVRQLREQIAAFQGHVSQKIMDEQTANVYIAKCELALRELSEAQSIDDAPRLIESGTKAMEAGNLRKAYIELIESVVVPVTLPGVETYRRLQRGEARVTSGISRRCVEVNFRNPVPHVGGYRIIAPMYRRHYNGFHELFKPDGSRLDLPTIATVAP